MDKILAKSTKIKRKWIIYYLQKNFDVIVFAAYSCAAAISPDPASTLPDPIRPLTENGRFFHRYSEKRL
uniref:hypothetical protein n=1 Tax=uncultured Draconibacterium sp. TaxID=1573823 RepID=UPI0032168DA1